MRGVEVQPIVVPNGTPEARIGVEIRNALIFDLTGGGGGGAPTHRLVIQLSTTRQQVIVDITTARPDVENYGINATYTLIENATGKPVMTGQTFSRVSYDIPGQEQRFARRPRTARRREPRRAGDLRQHQVAARVLFRRRDVSRRHAGPSLPRRNDVLS